MYRCAASSVYGSVCSALILLVLMLDVPTGQPWALDTAEFLPIHLSLPT